MRDHPISDEEATLCERISKTPSLGTKYLWERDSKYLEMHKGTLLWKTGFRKYIYTLGTSTMTYWWMPGKDVYMIDFLD
tara:strand:- start:1310 stop:1546 length:237 start_codon:yes stop_codon:yes gene_type:complete